MLAHRWHRSRREFLADVGRGVLIASVGSASAAELGLAPSAAIPLGQDPSLHFGDLEPLVALMQETAPDRLLPLLVDRLRAGEELRRLVAAGALANARTFGGEDYVGYHTLMALAPAWRMAAEMPTPQRALPVLKVLHRNAKRIQEAGGKAKEVLRPVQGVAVPAEGQVPGEALREAVRKKDIARAEQLFAGLAARGAEAMLEHLLVAVEDETEVHRVVLPYRAWDLLEVVGPERAHVLLRQSVRYCVQAESYARRRSDDGPRTLLPKLLEEHKLLGRAPGAREVDDAWVQALARTLFKASPRDAASAAAAALAEGVTPAAVGEAISLAANQLVLRDPGRSANEESPGKPLGSVHGDSVGVHACDSANAWRNLARVGGARNVFACLVLGAYQVALDRIARKGDFLAWDPLPSRQHLDRVKEADAAKLLAEAEEAIRGNLQARAAAVAQRYGDLGHAPRPLFDLLLKYAVSEDGSLHAEKFYRTVCEEFAATRPALRWAHIVALARVTASEHGRPAPGVAEARELLAAGRR